MILMIIFNYLGTLNYVNLFVCLLLKTVFVFFREFSSPHLLEMRVGELSCLRLLAMILMYCSKIQKKEFPLPLKTNLMLVSLSETQTFHSA